MINLNIKNFSNNLIIYIDQSVVSLSNFLIGVLLLRHLGLKEFGIFSILWFILYLVLSLQTASIINVLNSTINKSFNKQIFFNTTIFYCEIIFSIILIIFLIPALYIIFYKLNINDYNLYSLIFFYFIFQLNNFVKRIFYRNNLYTVNLVNNLIVYIGSLIFIILSIFYNNLSLQNIFNFFSILNFLTIFIFLKKLNNFFAISNRKIKHFFEIWNFSKWLILSSISNFFCLNLWQLNLAANVDLAVLGIYRACYNLSSFLNIFFQAFENIFPKKFSIYLMKNKSLNYIFKFNLNFIKNVFILVVPLIFILFIFLDKILFFIYGNELILEYSYVFFLTLTVVLLSIFGYPAMYTIRSFRQTKILFISNFTAALFAIFFSNIIISKFELNGLLFGSLLNQSILSFLPIFLFYLNYKK